MRKPITLPTIDTQALTTVTGGCKKKAPPPPPPQGGSDHESISVSVASGGATA